MLPLGRPVSITVFGLGYVGSVTAACLSQLGHRVFGVDKDEIKVNSIRAARAPFYEPGLEEIIAANVAAGRLSASVEPDEALRQSDIALICVGTPSDRNGNLGMDQLQRVFQVLEEHLRDRGRPLIVAVRSTVFPGTIDELKAAFLDGQGEAPIVSNPEFLREGTAVRDFMEPSLLVVGGEDRAAVRKVADLYAPLPVEACLVSLRAAEMIKYCCNAFHALKIAFANEIGTLAGRLNIAPDEVMETFCRDTRLNLSPAYLKPGFAFGGSCLPKDLRALTYRSLRMDLTLPLLESILPSNGRHLTRAMAEVLEQPVQRIGIFGLAFKENTDDLRESPVVAATEHWTGKGREVRIYDPHIRLDRIYGSNRNFVVTALPHIGKLLAGDIGEVLEWCDCLVIAQKPGPEFAGRIANCGKRIFNFAGAPLAHAASAE